MSSNPQDPQGLLSLADSTRRRRRRRRGRRSLDQRRRTPADLDDCLESVIKQRLSSEELEKYYPPICWDSEKSLDFLCLLSERLSWRPPEESPRYRAAESRRQSLRRELESRKQQIFNGKSIDDIDQNPSMMMNLSRIYCALCEISGGTACNFRSNSLEGMAGGSSTITYMDYSRIS